jgi:hypothetical protein
VTTNPPAPTPDAPDAGITVTGTTFNAVEAGLASPAALTNLTAVNPLVQATEGVAATNVTVSTFSDADPNVPAADFSATINWGDHASASTGTVTALSGGGFGVTGTHTYADEGNYTVSVVITNTASGQSVTGTTGAVVADAALSATPANFSASEGTAASNVRVATFTDANARATPADFTATIDRGDGTAASTGTVSAAAVGFQVTGTHTYAEGGSFRVVITINDVGTSSYTLASTATVADLPLTGTNLSFVPANDGGVTTLTATFADSDATEQPGAYSATITWGDGASDIGTVTGSGGSVTVTGNHPYEQAGTYGVSVTLQDGGGASASQSAPVTIADAPLAASGTTFSETAGLAGNGAVVATFADGNPDHNNNGLAVSDYTATVDWGDQTGLDATAAILVDNSSFAVVGGHVYANAGVYPVTVAVSDDDSQPVTVTSTAQVTTINPSGVALNANEGLPVYNAVIATFTDPQTSTYTSTVDWGDGSNPTPGTVSGSGGNYAVSGSHTYADGGSYSATVTITNAAGLPAVTLAPVTVFDPSLTASASAVTATRGQAFANVPVATFTDANAGEPVGNYGASIDWGDGNGTDLGTVSFAGGVFTVAGGHTYQAQGSFPVTVSIHDAGGSTSTVTTTATVSAPLSATGTTIQPSEGVAASSVPVATFTDVNTTGPFSATIDWGDGTGLSGGTVAGSGGQYTVLGSHTYDDDLAYSITVSVSDSSGNSDAAQSTALVAGATLSATGSAVQATEATAGTFVLTNFTDTNPTDSPSEYNAVINWGDGQTTLGVVSGGPVRSA